LSIIQYSRYRNCTVLQEIREIIRNTRLLPFFVQLGQKQSDSLGRLECRPVSTVCDMVMTYLRLNTKLYNPAIEDSCSSQLSSPCWARRYGMHFAASNRSGDHVPPPSRLSLSAQMGKTPIRADPLAFAISLGMTWVLLPLLHRILTLYTSNPLLTDKITTLTISFIPEINAQRYATSIQYSIFRG